MNNQMPSPSDYSRNPPRFSTIERFLESTKPKKADAWFDQIRPLWGKELSLGILDKTDIMSYLLTIETAMNMLSYGIEKTGRKIMVKMISELKLSGSIDGTMIENIFREKIQYEQTQHVHEHTEPQPRRGILGRRK